MPAWRVSAPLPPRCGLPARVGEEWSGGEEQIAGQRRTGSSRGPAARLTRPAGCGAARPRTRAARGAGAGQLDCRHVVCRLRNDVAPRALRGACAVVVHPSHDGLHALDVIARRLARVARGCAARRWGTGIGRGVGETRRGGRSGGGGGRRQKGGRRRRRRRHPESMDRAARPLPALPRIYSSSRMSLTHRAHCAGIAERPRAPAAGDVCSAIAPVSGIGLGSGCHQRAPPGVCSAVGRGGALVRLPRGQSGS